MHSKLPMRTRGNGSPFDEKAFRIHRLPVVTYFEVLVCVERWVPAQYAELPAVSEYM